MELIRGTMQRVQKLLGLAASGSRSHPAWHTHTSPAAEAVASAVSAGCSKGKGEIIKRAPIVPLRPTAVRNSGMHQGWWNEEQRPHFSRCMEWNFPLERHLIEHFTVFFPHLLEPPAQKGQRHVGEAQRPCFNSHFPLRTSKNHRVKTLVMTFCRALLHSVFLFKTPPLSAKCPV